MANFIIVSTGVCILFGIMEGLINANPLGRRLNASYQPIAKTSIIVLTGVVIGAIYGIVMTTAFWQIQPILPGESGLVKGLSLGLFAWFGREVMSVATIWMTHQVPRALLIYNLVTGLVEMLVLGAIIGTFLTV